MKLDHIYNVVGYISDISSNIPMLGQKQALNLNPLIPKTGR
jgi:hypothetical protein